MKIWITGGAGSGKSSLAQELAAALSRNGSKYYIATMVPRDEEDQRRIRRHILDRSGMGFETIECPSGLTDPSRGIVPDPDGTYLMDSATAMLSNAMFGEREFVYDPDAAAVVTADLAAFSEQVENFIAVSDGIYSDAMHYDGMTETYRRGLAQIEWEMASVCDTVIECAAGGVIVHKGALPAELGAGCGENNRAQLAELSADRRECNGVLQKTEEKKGLKLIIGGACQGKTEYARTQLGISEEEIFTCEEDREPDLQARCLDHFEQYLRGCVLRDRADRPDRQTVERTDRPLPAETRRNRRGSDPHGMRDPASPCKPGAKEEGNPQRDPPSAARYDGSKREAPLLWTSGLASQPCRKSSTAEKSSGRRSHIRGVGRLLYEWHEKDG